MSRDHKGLEESTQTRIDILARLENTVIESIIVHNRADKVVDYTVDRRYEGVKKNREEYLDQKMIDNGDSEFVVNADEYKRRFRVGFEGSRGVGKTLSRFPQNICRILTKFYTEEGDIVLDPFAGHNSRMESVHVSKRHYYGQDLCKEFMVDNFRRQKELLDAQAERIFDPTKYIIELTEGDSRFLPWPDNFGDFTITSPPYWDLEFYDDNEKQLGNGTYEKFLDGMFEVAKENIRVLKPGAFCIWNINDFRVDGKYYNYHGDLLQVMLKAGFIQWDIAIFDLGPSLRSVYLASAVKSKILPKRHEYALVMRKPLK